MYNVKAGHAESVEFILAMSAEKADSDTADSDKEKDDKPEPPKMCGMVYPNMPQCKYQVGFHYYPSKSHALKAMGWGSFKIDNEQNSYKGNCIGYSKHWNIRNPKFGSNRVGSLVDCKCCEDRGMQPTIRTLYKGI